MSEDRFIAAETFLKEFLKVSTDPQHDWAHADRVRKNAIKIMNLLPDVGVDKNLMQIICLIHDAHYAMYRIPLWIAYWFENYFALKAVTELVKRMDLTAEETHHIFQAVSQHARSFPFKDLHPMADPYVKILQDADTIDYFNRRRVRKFKKRNWFTRLISPLIDRFLRFGKRNIEDYLNYPIAAEVLEKGENL